MIFRHKDFLPEYLHLVQEKRYTDALPFIQKAARNNDAAAIGFLGCMYAMGKGVNKDMEEAYCLLLRAANLGHAKSQMALASMYQSGQGIQQNLREAAYWYYRSARGGYVEAFPFLQDILDDHPELIGPVISKNEVSDLLGAWKLHLANLH